MTFALFLFLFLFLSCANESESVMAETLLRGFFPGYAPGGSRDALMLFPCLTPESEPWNCFGFLDEMCHRCI